MDWNIDNIENMVSYINRELSNNRTMVNIEREEFGVNERVIHKRLVRLGYKKVNNQYRLQEGVTSNITPTKTHYKAIQEVSNTSNDIIQVKENIEPIMELQGIRDMEKLNILIDNIDLILNLISSKITSNTPGSRSGINDVKSFRVDTGLYKAIKERATRDNINISDVLNKALEDYLKNYL